MRCAPGCWASAVVLWLGACDGPALDHRGQAVVGGTAGGDPSVVMIEMEPGPCTGVVVAPRVVLTAAHCLGSRGVVRIGSGAPWDEVVTIIDHHRHRAYVSPDDGPDLGLLRLERAVGVAPSRIAVSSPRAPTTVTVVGFGRTAATDPASGGRRHGGLLSIAQVTASHLLSAATGSVFTCAGDSGGPGFDGDDRVAGVVSVGAPACNGAGRLTRVDIAAPWIATVIAAWDGPCADDGACAAGCVTIDPDCDRCGLDGSCQLQCPTPDLDCPLGGAAGDTCTGALDCESRDCAVAVDDVTVQFCSSTCRIDDACPAPTSACVDGQCRYPGPTSGILGAACTIDDQCRHGVCDRGLGACTAPCSAGARCPSGYECASSGQGPLCRRDDGCNAGGGGRWWWCAIALGPLLRRRRSASA
jgi:Trypsin